MRNYALTEPEANTARAALLLVQENLLDKKVRIERILAVQERPFNLQYQTISEQLEKVKAALDALK
jgi:hypothetical protein